MKKLLGTEEYKGFKIEIFDISKPYLEVLISHPEHGWKKKFYAGDDLMNKVIYIIDLWVFHIERKNA